MTGFLNQLNQQVDPTNQSFRVHTAFDFEPRPSSAGGGATRLEDITAGVHTNGQFAVFEFGAALPRAKLFSRWQAADDNTALAQLADPAFDPQQTVVIAEGAGVSAPPAVAVGNQGTVAIKRYEPKRVQVQADASAPSVLLLNDKYDPNWKVTVDGRAAPLLRCNFIMRGVFLQPGNHLVEFRFDPPHGTLYVSLAAIGVGLLLCAFLAFGPRSPAQASPVPAPEPVALKSKI
jgi:hypothetical protein